MCQDYKGEQMKKILVLIIAGIAFLYPLQAISLPSFMEIYNKDKFAKASKKNNCGICHVNPSGGGTLNNFGKAFDENNSKIDDGLRQQFPELFDLLQAITPRIKRVKPNKLMAGIEATLMIKGMNFAADSVVLVDGVEVDGAQFVSSKALNLTIILNEVGKHTVQVKDAAGQTSNLFKVKVKPLKD